MVAAWFPRMPLTLKTPTMFLGEAALELASQEVSR